MAQLPIIIDTGVWTDLWHFLNIFRNTTGKTYRELWELSENDQELLDFKKSQNSNGMLKVYDKIRDMAITKNYVVLVPNHISNEAGLRVSSKMYKTESNAIATKVEEFEDLVTSLPIETQVEIPIPLLKKGTDFPEKESDPTKAKQIMKQFLTELNDERINNLYYYWSSADDERKNKVNEKTAKLKKKIQIVQDKFKAWDKYMIKASKAHGFHPYESRTTLLNKLYSKITGYKNANLIKYEHPLERLTAKLTAGNEEFDFFALQIYLYAKEIGATIITHNTQAFQEINDPHFLGYFDDVNVIHPSINFENLDDLLNKKEFDEVIVNAILKDFFDLDIPICIELDYNLDHPVMESFAGEIITKTIKEYNADIPSEVKLAYNVSLGEVLEPLKIENRKLKVSQAFITGELNSHSLDIFKYIDENLFRGLTSEFIEDNVITDDFKTKKLKTNIIADYLGKKENIKKILVDFKTDGRPYLDIFLERYKATPFQDVTELLQILNIATLFSKGEIEEGLQLPEKVTLPEGCPPTAVKKREIGKCLLNWEQIEEFNEGKLESRDPQKVKIDSEKFLDYLKTVKDPKERMQLIEFAGKVLNLAEDHTSKISGPKVDEVTHLINNRKVLEHFSKVHSVSEALNYGAFSKSLLGDILYEDVKGVAFNLGFMAGGLALSELAAVALARGSAFAETEKVLLASGMKFASAFVSRFHSPLIALDLYNQIKALQAGDSSALIGIIGDSAFLIINAVEVGVALFEIAGLIEEVASVTGPMGLSIGAVVFVATEVFNAVKKVDKVDKVIHLTTGERWEMYATSIFTFGQVKLDVERLVPIKEANNNWAQQALEVLKKSEDIQRIVVPSAQLIGEDKIGVAPDNEFAPYDFESYVKWQRVRPDDPEGGRIFCAPEGDWENPPSWIMGRCTNAIGIVDLTEKKKNYTLFSLGDGIDKVQGFQDSPNIFRIGKGKKDLKGGEKNDVFILDEGLMFHDFPEGTVDGMGGSNILDLRGISGGNSEAVGVFFQEEPVGASVRQIIDVDSHQSYQPEIYFYNIDSIIGRENGVDFIYTNCSTKYVDGRGGLSYSADQIHIPHTYKECNHDKLIQLGPNTLLVNEAITGKFSYFVNDVHSYNRCILKRSEPFKKMVKDPVSNRIQHKFFINGTISDIVKFEFQHDESEHYDIDIRMYFQDKNGEVSMFNLETTLGYGKNNGGMDNLVIYLKDNVELRYHHNGVYALLKSKKPVPDLINKYHPIAVDFGISVFIFAENEGAIISIGSDQKDDVLHNDPAYKTYLVGNEGNNSYIIVSGQDVLVGPDPPIIPDVEIYCGNNEDHINTLDLHSLSKQIKEDLGMELLMKHTFDSETLIIYLYAVDKNKLKSEFQEDSYKKVTTITFRNPRINGAWESWCSKLQVILNKAPVVLKCDQDNNLHNLHPDVIDYNKDVVDYNPSHYYTPTPLVFNDYETVVIKEEDVEPHTEVVVMNDLGQYRFSRHHDDLVLTNGFDFKTPSYQPTSLVIKNFYKDPSIFYTLVFKFKDNVIDFGLEHDHIQNAIPIEDMYEEYDSFANDIVGDHSRRSRRDLDKIKDPLNRKKINGLNCLKSSVPGTKGTVLSYISEMGLRSLNYFKSIVSTAPEQVLGQNQDPNVDFSYGNGVGSEKILNSKTNIPLSNENKINYTNFNSTLLLLDTLVRKLSDSKYKLRNEDYILSPPAHVQKKIIEETTKLGLDYNDIGGSIEKKHQQLLNNLKEN